MKCLKYLIIFFLIAVSLTVEASTRRILIISTFDLEHPWTKKLCTEVNLRYRSAPAGPIVDYLVLNSILDRNGNFEEKFNLHLPLMRRGDYDIVVALMDDAIELILKNIDTLPNDLPIIFCGDPGFLKELNGKYPNIVGFGRSTELRQSVDLGLALYPQTEEIAIISDNFLSGRILNEQAQQELANFKRCKVTFLYGAKYNTKQMLAQVERMPQNTLIIFAPWRNFTQDGYASLEQIGRELRQAAKRPFLVFTDVLLGHGALGGILSEGDLLGRELTKTIDRILNGENLSSIGYSPMPNRCVIDLNEFDAEKLDRTLLPPGTILLNQKPSFFQEFPRLFTGVTILALLFVSAIAIIIILIIRHRGQCREMREQNAQKERKIERIFAEHSAVLNVIDDGLIVTDSNEYISFANPEAARLIGIPAAEMLGRPLADVLHLTNPQSREKIVSHVLGEISTPGKSQIADLIAVDNSRRCVRFHIEILRNNADVAIGTAVRFCDISHEYKQRASMDEISQLLENAAALANFSYAQINDDGTVLTNFTSQEHNWGYRNGRTLPPNEWLHPDDLPEFEHKWEVLRRRESDSARIEYRAIKDGSVRYFVMDLKRMPGVAHHGKTVYSCIIQDVTEIGKRRQELADRNVMFRSIIDLLPSPLAIKDPHDDYRLYIVNSTYAKLVGRNMEDIIGKTDFDLFSPEVADIFRKHDQEAVTENKINFQELFPGKNGNRIFLAYKALLSAPSNKLLLLTVSTDITEIEATKERALKSEQLLRTIIDNVPIGIYLKNPDEDYHYQLWNAQLAHDLGMSFSSAEGKSDFDLPFAPGRADYYRRQDEQIMRDQRSIVVEEDFFAPDGKKMIYRNTKMPVALHGNKRYILGCLENITEIRQITNCLKQTVDSQKNSLLREQIYNECLQFL
ncbi:MAG: PAS domain-containing protein, partial [Victivallaceae bacterium]